MYSQIEEVTRYGSFAFMLFSIISLFGTLLFPMIASSEKKIVKYILGMKSITLWAPFSLISTELSLKNELHRSGTILGLHNIFISAPQVLSIIIAGIIFKFTGYKKFEDIVSCKSKMDYSLVWVFQISGIAALVAMYLSFKISSEYTYISG
ncbi:unnamed protein product [Pneumocystis jirovecii]|uniref:Uncharacterized protein n=1 Tax=Pneumocystis jirovecii TaxID=42068 RepID=L0P9V5_PNEJI|nr:unnamed protein product [Pneumocystis jirovecii]